MKRTFSRVFFPVLALMPTSVHGTQIFDPTLSTCTRANCSSVVVGGTINSVGRFDGPSGRVAAGPWTVQIFADGNACLRLDVLVADVDLVMVAVAPNGETFFNDDRPDSLRPLLQIGGTQRGWYTVHVSPFAGNAVEADFLLSFARYNQDNPNCSPPTAAGGARTSGPKRAANGPPVTGGPID